MDQHTFCEIHERRGRSVIPVEEKQKKNLNTLNKTKLLEMFKVFVICEFLGQKVL